MLKLCEMPFYLFGSYQENTSLIVLIIASAYLLVLLLWIISSTRVICKVELNEEFILVPMMTTLGMTLISRLAYFAGGVEPLCFPRFWYFFASDIAALSKDICLLCLLIRVWEYLGSLESEENTYKFAKRYTYIFMIVHFFLGYTLTILEESDITPNMLAQYFGGIEIIMLFVFSYSFFKLSTAVRRNKHSNLEREVAVANWSLVIIVFTLLFRIAYNLGINNPVPQVQGKSKAVFILAMASELIPCVLITLILWLQQRTLMTSVVKYSLNSNINS
eukprot:TRINITY_DN6015_c0_g5_i1.p1 TRINITY_DN6015_c0_g5~~TRINITY_DN6015_c0_g5_i1.p1  ORF type:complete len:276 (+),score=15.21 TRINITY_DN6015_c0_g5_i1:70-897(+)